MTGQANRCENGRGTAYKDQAAGQFVAPECEAGQNQLVAERAEKSVEQSPLDVEALPKVQRFDREVIMKRVRAGDGSKGREPLQRQDAEKHKTQKTLEARQCAKTMPHGAQIP